MLLTDLIEETRRLLFTGQREERNKLAADLSFSATTIPFLYPLGSINRGCKLSIDLEDIYVWGINNQSATPVDRGQWGTIAAAHVASTVQVNVNPKFSNYEIYAAINNIIQDLSTPDNGLYYMVETELTFNSTINGYDFPYATALDIYEVRYAIPGPSNFWPVSREWELSRNMGPEFASNTALFLKDAFPNRSVVVKVKLPFTILAASMTADVATTFIPDTALNLLSIGAAYRLTLPREVKRNFDEIQGDTRRNTEVPPGANLGAARELGRLYKDGVTGEAARLNKLYPEFANRRPYNAGQASYGLYR